MDDRDTTNDETEWLALETADDAPEHVPCRTGARHVFLTRADLATYLDDESGREDARYQRDLAAYDVARTAWYRAHKHEHAKLSHAYNGYDGEPEPVCSHDYRAVAKTIKSLDRFRDRDGYRLEAWSHICAECGKAVYAEGKRTHGNNNRAATAKDRAYWARRPAAWHVPAYDAAQLCYNPEYDKDAKRTLDKMAKAAAHGWTVVLPPGTEVYAAPTAHSNLAVIAS